MSSYVALLRAINIGGRAKVGMAELRDLVAALGFASVRTHLQTGNLVFEGEAAADAELEALLEAEAARRLGLQTQIFVRRAEEVAGVVAANPFPLEAERAPNHLVVLFAKHELDPAPLREGYRGPEIFEARGRHLYCVYSEGIGESKLTNTVLERRLGGPVTGRNWNTVRKLAEMAGA